MSVCFQVVYNLGTPLKSLQPIATKQCTFIARAHVCSYLKLLSFIDHIVVALNEKCSPPAPMNQPIQFQINFAFALSQVIFYIVLVKIHFYKQYMVFNRKIKKISKCYSDQRKKHCFFCHIIHFIYYGIYFEHQQDFILCSESPHVLYFFRKIRC